MPQKHRSAIRNKIVINDNEKMSAKVLIVLAICVAMCYAQGPFGVSPDKILAALFDRRYFGRQLKCTTGDAPCDEVGRALKRLAPSLVRGQCPGCSSQDQQLVQGVLQYVQQEYPNEWSRLQQRYSG